MAHAASKASLAALEVATSILGLFSPSEEARRLLESAASRFGITLRPISPSFGTPPELGSEQAFLLYCHAVCSSAGAPSARLSQWLPGLAGYLGIPEKVAEHVASVVNSGQKSLPRTAVSSVVGFLEPTGEMKWLATWARVASEVRGTRIVVDVQAPQYEHPLDRAALATVRSIPGLETAIRKIAEHGIESVMRAEAYANSIQVGTDQFPEIHALLIECCRIAGVEKVPELFLVNGPLNAYTVGVQSPQIFVSQFMPVAFSRDELMFILGHELGHIRSGHAPLLLLRMVLPALAEVAGAVTLGLGSLFSAGATLKLNEWYRSSEFSCDRHGLLVCQDSDSAVSTLMKLAGAPLSRRSDFNLDAFLRQADSYDKISPTGVSAAYKYVSSYMNQGDHPWSALRARELLTWVKGGSYTALVDPQLNSPATNCRGCGTAVTPRSAFCMECGVKLAP